MQLLNINIHIHLASWDIFLHVDDMLLYLFIRDSREFNNG